MKNKRITSLLVGLLLIGSLTGCSVERKSRQNDSSSSSLSATISSNVSSSSIKVSTNDKNSTNNQNSNDDDNLPQDAKIFVHNISLIDLNNIDLSYRDELDAAYFIYNTLSNDSKLLPEVINAKNTLDEARELYAEMYENYLDNREAEETGFAFAELVAKYQDINSIIREDKEAIDRLKEIYSNLSDEAKALPEVIQAKSELDNAENRVNELINMSEDEYLIVQFIALVKKLPSVDELTILEVEQVNAVLNAYNSLSDANKSNVDVMASKTILDGLVERSNALVLIQEHADAFMEMAWGLPSSEQLEWKNATHDALIKAAENAYNNLTDEEKAVTGVSSAYAQVQAVRTYFDNMKEPYDINRLSPYINLGVPDKVGNYKSTFAYQGMDHITMLTTQYNIPREELKNHVVVYLNMYRQEHMTVVDGRPISEPLYQFDITENYTGIDIEDYILALQELAAQGNELAVSGKPYIFAVQIVSLNDNYASSKCSKQTAGFPITF